MKSKILLSLFLFITTIIYGQTFTYAGINYTVTDPTNFKVKIGANTSFSGVAIIPAVVVYASQNYDVTSISDYAFPSCTGLTSITIPNSVTYIGDSAFYGCSGLTSFIIPNSVTTIGSNAFMYCSGLTSVIIPNSVTAIGPSTFAGCTGLTTVTIPNSVTYLDHQTFAGCSGLTTVNCENASPPFLIGSPFAGVNQSSCTLNVPAGSVAAYEAMAVWTNFNPIIGSFLSTNFYDLYENIKVYPNPTQNSLNIQSTSTIFSTEIIDINGRTIQSLSQNSNDIILDIENFQSGIYLLKVTTENGSSIQKIIKK